MLMLSQRNVLAGDTTTILKFIDQAKELHKKGRPDSAEYYFKQADRLSKLIGHDNGRLSFLGNYSVFLYEASGNGEIGRCCQKSGKGIGNFLFDQKTEQSRPFRPAEIF